MFGPDTRTTVRFLGCCMGALGVRRFIGPGAYLALPKTQFYGEIAYGALGANGAIPGRNPQYRLIL